MIKTNYDLSQEILSKKDIIAERILTFHFEKLDKLQSNRINYLKQKTKEDTYYNIFHLSEAIRYESKDTFYHYIQWLKTLLNYYGVPDNDMIEHFEVFKKVVGQLFEYNSAQEINEYLDIGLEAYIKTEVNETSYLDKDNKHFKLANEYLEAILETDKTKAVNIILTAVKEGVPIEEIYLDVFEPVQYEVGWLWQTNRISVGQEHYATAVTQLAMSQLYPYIFKQEKKINRFAACGVSEELHELGIRMVADIFELYGWDTYFLGANTPAESIVKLIDEKEIHLLALSATILFHLKKVEDFITTIRRTCNKTPKIIVGGYAFRSDKELWKKVGADAYAGDPLSALKIAKNLIQN